MKKLQVRTLLASAALAVAVIAAPQAASAAETSTPQAATAAACNGVNKQEWVLYPDPNTGADVQDIYIDSCKVDDLIAAYGNAKDAAGLAGALGAAWWPAGVASGVMFAWAWNNQSQLIGCGSADNGIRIRVATGIITGCYGQ
ncbi:hypothetical protein [Microbacterium marinilacus]|uniref:Uncharacterized protein n=1 Tax=Microbacterium marinilacus TaxID=415209 RepID=A0ABP7BN79_9MICO|nr:hypothetical protein [Microbacterium marinilacus]MBY0688425.1 hypothetical protein [Microbacterium marinilacus]